MKNLFTLIVTILLAFLIREEGKAQWTSDPMSNTTIRDTLAWLVIPHVATSTSTGDTYISWFSATEGLRFDVYMQRLDSAGNKLWDNKGLLISNHNTDTWVSDYDLIVDQDNCAVLATQDQRDGHSNAFAYRISPDGEFLWGTDGIRLTNSSDFDPSPQILLTDNNQYIFSYGILPVDSTQNSTIGVQKLGAEGNMIWEMTISGAVSFLLPEQTLTSDGALMMAWASCYTSGDTLPGQENFIHFYLQKFSATTGLPEWFLPRQIDTGNVILWGSLYPKITVESDGDGGVYVSYPYFKNQKPVIMVSRIGPMGEFLWQDYGTQVAENADHEYMDGSMDYNAEQQKLYVSWREYKYDAVNLRACWAIGEQQFSTDGIRLWGDTGKLIIPFLCSTDTAYYNNNTASAGNSGQAVFYQMEHLDISGNDTMIMTENYASLIDQSGNPIWQNSHIPYAVHPSAKQHLTAGNYSNEQWIIAWEDNRQDPFQQQYTGIYAQNIGIDGMLGPLEVKEIHPAGTFDVSCYPNPFCDNVTVSYKMEHPGEVRLVLTDLMGRKLYEVNEGYQLAGGHSLQTAFRNIPDGIYFLRIQAGSDYTIIKVLKGRP